MLTYDKYDISELKIDTKRLNLGVRRSHSNWGKNWSMKRKTSVMSNIPNFGPNTYRNVPIGYDDFLDVLFLYWVEDLTAYEHGDLFYILGVSQLLMIYICYFVLSEKLSNT